MLIGMWLDVFHEDVPYSDDVADASCQYKEVEYGVHVSLLVDAIEYGSSDIAYAFGDDPDDSGWCHRII